MTNEQAPASAEKIKHPIVGMVVSTKGDKSITVLVERRVRHPIYGKYVRKSSRLHAHDENNECHDGDRVAIIETRPISRTKFFRLAEILERAQGAGEQA
ncbi:MAG: 30S ribosomal protein S17 [Nevskiaceae bacterium]|nr:MAG: 30S ribosomal protein S17 [Nevskiaceae bacterium]TBR72958.1 MAG: 30S ribosomal protein S17 [Nevskiaceae bacterium]